MSVPPTRHTEEDTHLQMEPGENRWWRPKWSEFQIFYRSWTVSKAGQINPFSRITWVLRTYHFAQRWNNYCSETFIIVCQFVLAGLLKQGMFQSLWGRTILKPSTWNPCHTLGALLIIEQSHKCLVADRNISISGLFQHPYFHIAATSGRPSINIVSHT